jgi:hypothetical protein
MHYEQSPSDNPNNPGLIRDEIEFQESNWHFDRGVFMHYEEVPDNPTEDNPEATNILTHPWGGDALYP